MTIFINQSTALSPIAGYGLEPVPNEPGYYRNTTEAYIPDGTVEPLWVGGYSFTRIAGNLLQPVIGRADVDVSLRPAGLRSGTLTMVAASLDDALVLEAMHSAVGPLTLTDTESPLLNMVYVASGTISMTRDEEIHAMWLITVDFQEVSA